MRKFATLALGFLSLASVAGAWDYSPTQIAEQKIVRTVAANPADEVMQTIYDNETLVKGIEQATLAADGKSIRSLMGQLSEPLSGDLEKAGRRFLQENANLFNLPTARNMQVVTLTNLDSGEATHLTYGMTIDGVAVRDARVTLHIGADRRVQLTQGSFPTVEAIDNGIALSEARAIAAGKLAVSVKALRGTPSAKLVVMPTDAGHARMAYVVTIPALQPLGDWELAIDAQTGAELSRPNQMAFSRVEPVTGQGAAYLSHPLNGAPIIVDLKHFTTTTLTGLYANVVNAKGATAVSESYYHVYAPEDTHFDEVNMYFNLNRIHDLFKKLGFNSMDFAIKAEVHYGNAYDNAYYSPQTNSMAFGDGNKLNDLSKEASVAWHEYSHATLQRIRNLAYKGESGAMNEGQADYFACTISGDPLVGPWAMKKLNRPYLRSLIENKHYPEDIKNEVHEDGKIWGCALWDLRTALGAEATDLLVHKSFFYLSDGSPTFKDGVNAIITADKNINGGANKATIMKVFQGRGIMKAEGSLELSGANIRAMNAFQKIHH